MARLSGLDVGTVMTTLRWLESEGLLELSRRKRVGEVGHVIDFRLSTALFSDGQELSMPMAGELAHSGLWSALPTAGARHLYAIIRALDPIRDADAYLESIADDRGRGPWDYEDPPEALDNDGYALQLSFLIDRVWKVSCRHSMRRLEALSGMKEDAIREGLAVLASPIFDSDEGPPFGLIIRGNAPRGSTDWFAIDPRSSLAFFAGFPTISAVREVRDDFRRSTWPWLYRDRELSRKRKETRDERARREIECERHREGMRMIRKAIGRSR